MFENDTIKFNKLLLVQKDVSVQVMSKIQSHIY